MSAYSPRPSSAAMGYAVIDVETTGFSPTTDRVIEMAVVHTDGAGSITDEWVSRFNPERPVAATFVHGITDADLRDQPLLADVIPDIVDRLRGRAVVAHNAPFDMAFLRAEFGRSGWRIPATPVLCTLDASTRYLPRLRRRSLSDCCEGIGIDFRSAHAALSDARATAWLLARFLDPEVPPPPNPEDIGLAEAAVSVAWPDAPDESPAPCVPPSSPVAAGTGAPLRIRRKRVSASLMSLLADYPLAEALDAGAPEGSVAYLELLLEVLADGVLTVGEGHRLAGLAQVYGLSPQDIALAHRGFLLAMGHLAVADGTVARDERDEMIEICSLLGEPSDLIPSVLSSARSLAARKASEHLAPLPRDWSHGEPLRVGDGVAFTGCDDAQREQLEEAARTAGVRITGSVSGRTAILVSDGSMNGTKAARAREIGTRVVHPDEFEVLLRHVQPAITDAPPTRSPRAGVELPAGIDPTEVRSWAKAQGHDIGDRGRIRVDIIEAYVLATQRSDFPPKEPTS